MTRNAGIQSHARPFGHDKPTITPAIGTHQSNTPFHPRSKSSDSQDFAPPGFGSIFSIPASSLSSSISGRKFLARINAR
jgi:hypothetical protein